MKKVGSLVLITLMILSLALVPGIKGETNPVELTFDKDTYITYTGGTFAAVISLNPNNNQVGGVQFSVTWDPEYLEFVNYTVGDAGASAFPTINDQHVSEGYIEAGFMNFQGISSGEMLILTFKAKKDGTTELAVNIVDVTDISAQSIEAVGDTATVTIQKAVIANFTFSPTKPAVGQEVTFDASVSQAIVGTITEYSWDFGDGTTAAGKIVTHKYLEPGVYNVTLTVTGDQGADSITKQIEVINHPPVVENITPLILNSSIGYVKFEAAVKDEDIQYGVDELTYVWYFGDGENQTTTEPTAEHYYKKGGEYTVTLLVKDKFGGEGSKSITFTLEGVIKAVVLPQNTTPLVYSLNVTEEYGITSETYARLQPEYTSAFEFIDKIVREYVDTAMYEMIATESQNFVNEEISKYINTTKEVKILKDEKTFNLTESRPFLEDGVWNLTFRWIRHVEVIGTNKTNPVDLVRLIITENRTVNLTVTFPPIKEQNAPVVNITSPTEKVYNVTTIPIKVHITDDSTVKNVTAFLDGVKIELEYNSTSGLYEAIALSLANGSHVLKVYARDKYGNLGVAEVYFVVHEAAKIVPVGNVTVGVIGNATVTSANNTIVVNATVDGTEVTVEIPVTENVTNIVVNTTAIEDVVKGKENATLVAGWNATIAGKPEVVPVKEEEMQDGKKIIKEKVTVEVNVTMGENGLAVLAIPIGEREVKIVKTLKENGSEVVLTTNKSAEIGYYYIENGILFIVLKKDPTVIVEAEKVTEQTVVSGGISLSTLNFIYYIWYNKGSRTFDELYNKSIELEIDNETIQEALHYKELAEQYYEKAKQFGPVIQNLNNPRIMASLRKAYLNLRKAARILEKAIEEAESS